jgi:ATPase subunit of ABC transporter with duplicated ATPase domains
MSLEFHDDWTGVTGDNGAGKSTFLMLAAGILEPQSGNISPAALSGPAGGAVAAAAGSGSGAASVAAAGTRGLYCPQRTDQVPEGWEDFFFDGGGSLMSRLGIKADWPYRWESLSHGERKRLQLGIALWRQPELLLIDEPTNHLDREAKALIGSALESYSGIGLLVSHDRALLDRLCGQCLFIRRGRAMLRPGGISRGLAEEEREAREGRRQRALLTRERDRLAAAAEDRRRVVEGSKNRLSKKNLKPGDSDARGKINLARLSGKDRAGADQYKRMENRLAGLEKTLAAAAVPPSRKQGLTLLTERGKMDRIALIPAGSILLGGEGVPGGRLLSFPELLIRPGDRIALTGPNGAGKSSLVRHIVKQIPSRLLYIPQEISAGEGQAALENMREETEKDRGEILARFSRLGSDPGLLLQSRLPSPGEIRKLLIARGVFSQPAIIIMDEPTNHLDLSSIRLLEELLAEVPCALLLVSHDEAFLAALTGREWHISGGMLTMG